MPASDTRETNTQTAREQTQHKTNAILDMTAQTTGIAYNTDPYSTNLPGSWEPKFCKPG